MAVVSIPGISSSVGLRVSLGVSLTLLAFSLFFSRGNYGKSIAVNATVGITINTCVIDMSGWVSIGNSGHGVGDSWCANSVSMGNSVETGIGESIAIGGSVRVSVVSTVSTIVSVTISVSMAIVSVPSISCGISLRGGLRLSKCQTGQ